MAGVSPLSSCQICRTTIQQDKNQCSHHLCQACSVSLYPEEYQGHFKGCPLCYNLSRSRTEQDSFLFKEVLEGFAFLAEDAAPSSDIAKTNSNTCTDNIAVPNTANRASGNPAENQLSEYDYMVASPDLSQSRNNGIDLYPNPHTTNPIPGYDYAPTLIQSSIDLCSGLPNDAMTDYHPSVMSSTEGNTSTRVDRMVVSPPLDTSGNISKDGLAIVNVNTLVSPSSDFTARISPYSVKGMKSNKQIHNTHGNIPSSNANTASTLYEGDISSKPKYGNSFNHISGIHSTAMVTSGSNIKRTLQSNIKCVPPVNLTVNQTKLKEMPQTYMSQQQLVPASDNSASMNQTMQHPIFQPPLHNQNVNLFSTSPNYPGNSFIPMPMNNGLYPSDTITNISPLNCSQNEIQLPVSDNIFQMPLHHDAMVPGIVSIGNTSPVGYLPQQANVPVSGNMPFTMNTAPIMDQPAVIMSCEIPTNTSTTTQGKSKGSASKYKSKNSTRHPSSKNNDSKQHCRSSSKLKVSDTQKQKLPSSKNIPSTVEAERDESCRHCKRSNVTWFCVNCEFNLCDICQGTHVEFQEFRNHRVIKLPDEDDKYMQLSPPARSPQSNDTWMEITGSAPPLLERVKEKLQTIRTKRKSAQNVSEKLEELAQGISAMYNNIVSQANSAAEAKINRIKSDLEEIETAVKISRDRAAEESRSLQQQLSSVISQMDSLLVMGENVCNMTPADSGSGLNGDVVSSLQKNVLNHIDILPDQSRTLNAAQDYLKKNVEILKFRPHTEKSVGNTVGSLAQQGDVSGGGKPKQDSVSSLMTDLVLKSPAARLSSDSVNSLNESLNSGQNTVMSSMRQDSSMPPPTQPVKKCLDIMLTQALMSPKPPEEIEILDDSDDNADIPVFVEEENKVNALNPTIAFNISCRISEENLFEMCTMKTPKKIKNFELQNFYTRLCFYDDSLYCACFNKNCIDIYSREGVFMQSVSCGVIKCPRVIQPLSPVNEGGSGGGLLLVAAYSGLYTMAVGGKWPVKQIKKGMFRDVHISGDIVAALEKGPEDAQDAVLVLTVSGFREKHQFSLGSDSAWSLLVSGDSIYVSSGSYLTSSSTILKYSHSGQLVEQYGRYGKSVPGELCTPYLCMIDKEHSIVVADHLNNKLQVLSGSGQWSVIHGLQLKYPSDVIIVGSYMYVVDLNNVLIYNFK